MEELKTLERELTTADLAKNDAPTQLDGLRLVKGHEAEARSSFDRLLKP